jgi:hypothetical protein
MSALPWQYCILVVWNSEDQGKTLKSGFRWHLGIGRCHEAFKSMVVSLDTSFGTLSPHDLHLWVWRFIFLK